MKRRLFSILLGALLALSSIGSVLAGSNPGYEGQPGNQSSGGGGGNQGYEGQPGNQSH
jgi:hypothetical protein